MKYIITLIIYSAGIFLYFYNDYKYHLNENYKNVISQVMNNYNSAINAHELSNDTFHAMYSDTLARIVSESNGATEEKIAELQDQLRAYFLDFYNLKKHEILEGFTIIDSKSDVLYRFHNPKQFGDSLREKDMVDSVAKNFLYEKGFDVDKYTEAFYFTYPLFWDGEYVGMYQYALSLEALIQHMEKADDASYIFIFSKEILEKNLSQLQLYTNYKHFKIGEKVFSANLKSLQEFKNCTACNELLIEQDFLEAFDTEDITNIYYKDETLHKTLSIFPVKKFNGNIGGYLIVDRDKNPKIEFLQRFLFDGLLMFFAGAIVLFYYRRMYNHHLYVRNLLDSQHQMLAVTNGVELKDANKTFLRFFDYKNILQFKKEHDCVCDFFLPHEGYLQTDMGDMNWYQYLLTYPYVPHKVKMLDKVLGEVRIFELNSEYFTNTKKTFLSFRDITDQLLHEEELEKKANFDKLTSIYNRQKFDFILENELRKAQRYNTLFSLIMFDLDHFKKVNDTYGHNVGDYVLMEICRVVSEHIRDVDIFARWGGEEFMIIINTPLIPAEKLAEKLRLLIQNHSFNYGIRLTCSFGVTEFQNEDTAKTITKRVDTLLYSAKDGGRNCVRSDTNP